MVEPTGAPPGLELVRHWCHVAAQTTESQRFLLSHLASGLVGRGWLHPLDKLRESAADALGEPVDRVQADLDALIALDLVTVQDGKVTTVGALLAARSTGIDFVLDAQHAVHLVGPLAALAAAVALHRKGEVRGVCTGDGTTRLVLVCDASGIYERRPESIGLFLPAWDGQSSPAAQSAGGGLFRDDDALGRWQEQHGDPPGMPVASFLFPMAAAELGEELGRGLAPLFDRLPDYD